MTEETVANKAKPVCTQSIIYETQKRNDEPKEKN